MSPKSPPEKKTELDTSRAPFMEHLEELRQRLWRALLGVIIAAGACYIFHNELRVFLTAPLYVVLKTMGLPEETYFRSVHGAFVLNLKIAFLGGIFFGAPIVLYQTWMFVAPGLYRKEQRLAAPFVVLSTLCFAGGGYFGYAAVLPGAFEFLVGFAELGGEHRMLPQIMMEDYLGFTTKLLLAFGIVFEMPVVVAFLAALGILTHRVLIKYWRYALVMAFVLGALLTPPDWFSQIMLAAPLVVLYGLSIGIAYLITRHRATGDETTSD